MNVGGGRPRLFVILPGVREVEDDAMELLPLLRGLLGIVEPLLFLEPRGIDAKVGLHFELLQLADVGKR